MLRCLGDSISSVIKLVKMKGINISLSLVVCFVLFSLSNGYRVQRSDDDTDDLIDNPTIDEGNVDLNSNSIDELIGEIQNNLNDVDDNNDNDDDNPINADPIDADPIDADPIDTNPIDTDPIDADPIDADPIDEDSIDEDPIVEDTIDEDTIDESNPDSQIDVTEPGPDEGVEGSLEVTDLPDICQGSKNFVPNIKNCSSFYNCTNKESSSCPNEMWFDPNYTGDTLCQYPEVICAADNNICDCAELYPPPPLDPLIENTATCLRDNRFHLIPSKVNCGRYFVCHNEMAYRMECRAGLHYNAKTEMCDYAEVVNCRIPDPDCPLEGIKFLPDAARCEVFYFCVHGFKTKQSCPFYHIWDIRTNSCQRQDEAICHLTN